MNKEIIYISVKIVVCLMIALKVVRFQETGELKEGLWVIIFLMILFN